MPLKGRRTQEMVAPGVTNAVETRIVEPTANQSSKERKCSDLKNSVYDVVTGKDTFAKTTREIAEYVGREFDDAGEFRTGMVEMQLRPLDEPVPPADPNQVVEFELWKMARCTYEKQLEARRCNASRVYALIIGQCSQAL
jgi:hypothetical protein